MNDIKDTIGNLLSQEKFTEVCFSCMNWDQQELQRPVIADLYECHKDTVIKIVFNSLSSVDIYILFHPEGNEPIDDPNIKMNMFAEVPRHTPTQRIIDGFMIQAYKHICERLMGINLEKL